MANKEAPSGDADDSTIEAAAQKAAAIVNDELASLPTAHEYDYGGHLLKLGEYDVCLRCTAPIAEAQQAYKRLESRAKSEEDLNIKEHLEIAAELLKAEARAAEVRAELHNGKNSETIVNTLLGFIHARSIHDTYDHSHHGGA